MVDDWFREVFYFISSSPEDSGLILETEGLRNFYKLFL